MLEVNALPFIKAITTLRTLVERADRYDKDDVVTDLFKDKTREALLDLLDTFDIVGCRSARVANIRLINSLDDPNITFGNLAIRSSEIESRFADHLSDIRLLVLQPNEAALMLPVDSLLGAIGPQVAGFSAAFPSASLEIEEAAKCYALNRYTASVFHCMRALECGIAAFAKLIKIDDPTRPAEKNWGRILKVIKDRLDEEWPKNNRLNGTEGAEYEKIFATLDAVKNPWRNATMHVENVYQPHEALHINRCVAMFLVEIARHCDENGRKRDSAPAMAAIESANDDSKVDQ